MKMLEKDIYKEGAYIVGQPDIGGPWISFGDLNLNFTGWSHATRENCFSYVFSCYISWPETTGCVVVPK